MHILFVCLGNICRSPTAEGVMRQLVAEAGLQDEIELDSAGTGAWHVGEPPDARATAAAARRGIALDSVARQVCRTDFERFDLILAMDGSNQHALRQLAPDERRAREGASVARVRSRERRYCTISTCPTLTTTVSAALRSCSTRCRRPVRVCCDRLRSAEPRVT